VPDYSEFVLFDAKMSDAVTGPMPAVMREYWLGATVRINALVQEDSGMALQAAMAHAKQELVEHLFGEFKPGLYKLRRLIEGGDRRGALELLENVMHDMYDATY
jgi:hypothetical protein